MGFGLCWARSLGDRLMLVLYYDEVLVIGFFRSTKDRDY